MSTFLDKLLRKKPDPYPPIPGYTPPEFEPESDHGQHREVHARAVSEIPEPRLSDEPQIVFYGRARIFNDFDHLGIDVLTVQFAPGAHYADVRLDPDDGVRLIDQLLPGEPMLWTEEELRSAGDMFTRAADQLRHTQQPSASAAE